MVHEKSSDIAAANGFPSPSASAAKTSVINCLLRCGSIGAFSPERQPSLVPPPPEDVGHRVDSVEEEDSVEVIQLVQQAARLESLGDHARRALRDGRGLHDDPGRASDV